MRRYLPVAAFVVVLAVAGTILYFVTTSTRDIPKTAPKGAPTAGTCWQVDPTTAAQALPWPGSAVSCTAAHTVEIYLVGQAGPDLLRRLDKASGDDKKVVENLLYAQARRACELGAPIYLGGAWHDAQVQVTASWIKPAKNGFYACGLAQVTGPAATSFAGRTTSLKNALRTGDQPLAIACISRGTELRYVDCAGPHDGEYVGSYTITPLDAPFDPKAVPAAAQKGCADVALGYLGLPAGQTRDDLSAGSVGPKSASDWLGSDQTFGCYLLAASGTLKGSVKGLGTKPLPR